MKKYRVKVTEKHSDYVWVTAASAGEAKNKAPEHSQCEFELLYDCEIMEERECEEYECECENLDYE